MNEDPKVKKWADQMEEQAKATPEYSLMRIANSLEIIAASLVGIEAGLDDIIAYDGEVHYIRTSRPE